MNSLKYTQQSEDYQRIEKAIQFVENNFRTQPTLDQIAAGVHLSKYHFDRLFKRWVGISPMQFMQYLTLDYTKDRLAGHQSLLDVSLDAGLSGPSRLHDLFVTFEAMTPGEFKRMGAGLQIGYGFAPSPFGECLLAMTDRGICHLGFVGGENRSGALEQIRQAWPGARLTDQQAAVETVAGRIFSLHRVSDERPFHLHLKGTNFQINVWRALLTIPTGQVASYEHVAAYAGRPKAVRAVANAIAVNPVAYLIPCHRVIAKSGKIHAYRWGSARKKAMLGWEAAGARI